ncbi:MAG: peptidoglycan DD-metalloendopeptidase family protein [Thermodesulfobacteriota bacterium]|nr:peptidoglycan DD-metalloendopeptidase family protein [Thermodesulfobacteriota bacterium]
MNRRFFFFLYLFISFALLLLSIPFNYSSASSLAQSNKKKNQIQKIQKDLSREKEQLLKFGIKEKSLLEQLTNLEKEIVEKRRILKALKEKIHFNKIELKRCQRKLSQFEKSIKVITKRLNKRLVAFYKYAKRGYMQIIASSEDLDQLRKGMQYLQIIMKEDQQLLLQMADVKLKYDQEISLKKEKLAVIHTMEKEESGQLSVLKKNIEKKVIFLMKIHREKEFYETAVKELQLAALNLRKTLLNLEKGTKKKKISLTGFGNFRGKLPPPLAGKILKKRNPLGSKNLHTHKGIYIKGPLGAEVMAIFPGRVDFSGWLKGYGQIIVINHGSRYFTISAHLLQRNLEEGHAVEKGEVIGLLGQTGSLEGPGLYFEMRRGGTNLDPLKWLKVD